MEIVSAVLIISGTLQIYHFSPVDLKRLTDAFQSKNARDASMVFPILDQYGEHKSTLHVRVGTIDAILEHLREVKK